MWHATLRKTASDGGSRRFPLAALAAGPSQGTKPAFACCYCGRAFIASSCSPSARSCSLWRAYIHLDRGFTRQQPRPAIAIRHPPSAIRHRHPASGPAGTGPRPQAPGIATGTGTDRHTNKRLVKHEPPLLAKASPACTAAATCPARILRCIHSSTTTTTTVPFPAAVAVAVTRRPPPRCFFLFGLLPLPGHETDAIDSPHAPKPKPPPPPLSLRYQEYATQRSATQRSAAQRQRGTPQLRSFPQRTHTPLRASTLTPAPSALAAEPPQTGRIGLHTYTHAAMVEDKYIGLMLAMSSSLAIGASFVITKKGLNASIEKHGFNGDGFGYLQNPVWWAGIITMVLGEIFNFAAYAFAPAILVTPLGALSVLIGAVLGSYFLDEQLGLLGKIGCAICLIGSVIIVLHAPPDKEVQSVEEILNLALQPGFLFYCAFCIVFCVFMIYKIAPKYGRKNPLIYLSICSTSGSVSIMFIKAFGIALKMTFAGNNQFTHPSTYVFVILVLGCILTQMNYFNKALSQFSTNIVNPLYYVTFTTCTLVASCLLFQGFNTTSTVNTVSLLCGFLIIFSGVYLLNLSREDPNGNQSLGSRFTDGPPSDAISGFPTRRSMQSRRSEDLFERQSMGIARNSRSGRNSRSSYADAGDRSALMHDYDAENQFELSDLADSDDDLESGRNAKRTSFDEDTRLNGRLSGTGRGRVQKESVQPKRNNSSRR